MADVMRRILGIDPGTKTCGYAVLESDGRTIRTIDYGVVGNRKVSLASRLKLIHEGLTAVIGRCQPEVAAIEGAFYGRNPRTTIRIGEGRGVALLAAASAGLEIAEYAPAKVKQAVVGSGRATKRQVQMMVRDILNLPEVPTPDDAADALAIAICHCHRQRLGDL